MDFKVANQRLYKETSLKTGVSPHQVEEFLRVMCNFTEEVISRGGCETVMWPNFGKFKIKPMRFQFLENMMNEKRQQDETIRSERIGRSNSKQSLDISDTGVSESV